MRVIAAIFVTILSASGAAAQGCGPTNPNCIVPNRPAGDSTDAAANTAFVTSAIATAASQTYANGYTTSGSTTLGPTQSGKVIGNTAPAQTFTLPAPTSGLVFIPINTQSGTLTVTAGSGNIIGPTAPGARR